VIAYALYPGIMADTEQGDRLIEELVCIQLHGTLASDPFLQFHLVAAVIRPLLRVSLARNETIASSCQTPLPSGVSSQHAKALGRLGQQMTINRYCTYW